MSAPSTIDVPDLIKRCCAGEQILDVVDRDEIGLGLFLSEIQDAAPALGRDPLTGNRHGRRVLAPRSASADLDPAERDAKIVAGYLGGLSIAALTVLYDLHSDDVRSALKACGEPDIKNRHAAASTARWRSELGRAAHAYTREHPNLTVEQAHAALPHRPGDRAFLFSLLTEYARNTGEESARPGSVIARRDEEVYAAWLTLEGISSIGNRHGIDSNRVRKIILARDPQMETTRAQMVAERRAERKKNKAPKAQKRLPALVAALTEYANATGQSALVLTPEIRSKFDIRSGDSERLRALMPEITILHGKSGERRVYSDEQMLDALREVATTLGRPPISEKEYSKVRTPGRHPAGITIVKRLGWSRALRLSGVDPDAVSFRERNDRVSDDLILAHVRVFLDSAPRPSTSLYLEYANTTGAPSLSTVNTRFGSWTKAAVAASALMPGRAQEVVTFASDISPERLLSEADIEKIVHGYLAKKNPILIARRHHITHDRVRTLVAVCSPEGLRPMPRAVKRGITDDEVDAALREVAQQAGLKAIGALDYERLHQPGKHPSLRTVSRHPSWAVAARRAGVSLDQDT